ncbi:recombinase family protein [Calothrix sp. FACHB-1219]|uniref:fdxN element excision recombinase XisF n=1 Tax=unclassified Calothrix TaxID=2619626 RepID=UPI00168A0410|nr:MULTISPECIES: fdxN element excision recombinase XisF [unclassified Calothrix]MBD2201826.1 recombinase family protein [Calothrix sp. FACHB-168]MBD2217512.1 recombinase family protein [Calothrix sp. FACHB-1219]
MKVGYVRVSNREQALTDALNQQTNRVEKEGVIEIFSDIESGKSSDRKNFNRMINLVKKRKITEVVVTRIDRLGRSVIGINKVISLFETYGVKLTIIDAPVDPSSPFGWFQVNQMAGLAEFESRLLSDRIKHGLDYFREQHKACPQIPFGYMRVDEKYSPDRNNWEIAIDIINYFIYENVSLRKAAIYSLEKHNKKWTPTGLRKWMTNPVLRGHTVYYRRSRSDNPDDWKVISNTHTPLISEANYKLILDKLKDNKHKYAYGNNKSNKDPLPLSGLILCGDCGFHCRFKTPHGNTYRLRCIKRDTLGELNCSNGRSTRLAYVIQKVDEALVSRYEKLIAYTLDNIEVKIQSHPEIIKNEATLAGLRNLQGNPFVDEAIQGILESIEQIKHSIIKETQVDKELFNILESSYSNIEFFQDISWLDKVVIYKQLVREVRVLNGEVLEVKLLV